MTTARAHKIRHFSRPRRSSGPMRSGAGCSRRSSRSTGGHQEAPECAGTLPGAAMGLRGPRTSTRGRLRQDGRKSALERFVPAEELARRRRQAREARSRGSSARSSPSARRTSSSSGTATCWPRSPSAATRCRARRSSATSRAGGASRSTRETAPTSGTSSTTRSARSTWPGRGPAGDLRDRARRVRGRPAGPARGPDEGDRREGSNIRSIEARSEDRQGYVSVALEIAGLKHLEKILSRLSAVHGVREVIRRYNVPKAGERE